MSQLSRALRKRKLNWFSAFGIAMTLVRGVTEAMADDGKIDGQEMVEIITDVFEELTGGTPEDFGIKIKL